VADAGRHDLDQHFAGAGPSRSTSWISSGRFGATAMAARVFIRPPVSVRVERSRDTFARALLDFARSERLGLAFSQAFPILQDRLAALCPGAPVTPPPGWAPEPHR
jgi:hypothetical protein